MPPQTPSAPLRVLIVEDDPAQRTGLSQLVSGWGFDTDSAPDGEAALVQVAQKPPDVILSDMVMPKMGGLDLLRALRQQDHDITVLILTAQGTVSSAVEAIQLGAYDYVAKPIDPQRLRILLDQVSERHARQQEVTVLRRQLQERGRFGKMIGSSPAMREVYRLIEQAAPTGASVFITGESGTGKELVAQTLHQLSNRAAKPFVAINCAAIPEALLESELFGHEKGAFTGAIARRRGSFELADRGTVFLDEVAEMQTATQAKLLRVLQERVVQPLGGDRTRTIDIRVIAATNTDPAAAVKEGRLREDLYYRLNVINLQLPPLRERPEDLPLLAQAFVTEFARDLGKSIAGVAEEALAVLRAHRWPGNIRELRNVLERATIVARGNFVTPEDLSGFGTPLGGAPTEAPEPAPTTGEAAATQPPEGGTALPHRPAAPLPDSGDIPTLVAGMTVAEAERQLIAITLEHTGGNKTKAAAMLGISLKTLHNKLVREAARRAAGES